MKSDSIPILSRSDTGAFFDRTEIRAIAKALTPEKSATQRDYLVQFAGT